MKLIALVPVKNEARILSTTLGCLNEFCDHIIVSDHQSTDNSVKIAKNFSKVNLIQNHSPQGADHGRPAMFDAARQFDGNNLILSIDADEITPPKIFSGLKKFVLEQYQQGTFFSLWWVQLWRDLNFYRDDSSVWSNNYHPMLFYDDRQHNHWGERYFLHGGRMPTNVNKSKIVQLKKFPVLHLQWVYWERTQFKQAHYRMIEFIEKDFKHAEAINETYSITLGQDEEGLAQVPKNWLAGISFPSDLMNIHPSWHYDDIFKLFKQYGVSAFEPLQIWHINELRDYFILNTGRAPKINISNIKPRRHAAKPLLRRMLPKAVINYIKKFR